MLQMKSGLETRAILKLYDRRFAIALRRRERAKPWTPTIEEVYKQYVLNDRAEKLFDRTFIIPSFRHSPPFAQIFRYYGHPD